MANPILAKTIRANLVENIHRGAFCLINSKNQIKIAQGDISNSIFPHSAIKSIQALALFKSGAVEKFSLDEKDLAIICASHNGEKPHIEAVKRLLNKISCNIDDLECGSHVPINKKAQKTFFTSKEKLTPIYNACSGKHAGMLAVAKALEISTKNYSTPNHKVQKLVRLCIEGIIGQDLNETHCAIDGCSVPTFAAPLSAFAFAFAKMATNTSFNKQTTKAVKQIISANINEAKLIRGTNTLDSDLIKAFSGRLIIKNGSDGVYCGALLDKKLGFALKIDDGNLQAAEVTIANMLLNFSNPNEKERLALKNYSSSILTNWRKIEVGKLIATD